MRLILIISAALFVVMGQGDIRAEERENGKPNVVVADPLAAPVQLSDSQYRVGPPDVLAVEMRQGGPSAPHKIEIYDVLQIRVPDTLHDQPIDGFYLVEGEGIVTLGPAYGRAQVVDMTVEQAAEAIKVKLGEVLSKPEVSVQLARTAAASATGEYMVGPDGTINLRKYGTLHVSDKTVTDIRNDLQKHLAQYFDSPQVAVEVRQYNSKAYYVITEGAGLGDSVRRIPFTGTGTVLDALSVGSGPSVSNVNVWIARPAPGFDCEQILPVDYEEMARGGSDATNYQLMPGDRVFVSEDILTHAVQTLNNNDQTDSRVCPCKRKRARRRLFFGRRR